MFFLSTLITVTCYESDLPDVINGEVTFTPPHLETSRLPEGKRYTGTIATYSCSSGYQLVGSSLRACGADGTWNGTTTSCYSGK